MIGNILIVDDEKRLAGHLARLLEKEGFIANKAHSADEARAMMKQHYPDVVLMDLMLPDADGSQLMTELSKTYKDTRFIIITAYASIRSAVESTKKGAFDYLTKPFEPEQMFHAISSALKGRRIGEEIKRLRESNCYIPAGHSQRRDELDYPSPAMQHIRSLALKAAEQDGIVLLGGESGTGKDHLARCIHRLSKRSEGPYFSINCAALTRELAESELFGHEPGAFTGTRGRKRGLLELAEKGSILLNEVGDLDAAIQSKLLTFLDTRSFVRVGGEKSIRIDARLFAATNKDLTAEVKSGDFRKDLYYRLNVFPLQLPSLRERREDIPVLVEELFLKLKEDLGLHSTPEVTKTAMNALVDYHWPGNIRELRNVLERAIMLNRGRPIERKHLGLDGDLGEWTHTIRFPRNKSLHSVTQEAARNIVLEALRRSGGKKKDAAEMLKISRHALAHQLKSLNIKA